MNKITVRRAGVSDAALLAQTRKKAWAATYRGIYPDEWIDHYDEAAHTAKELARLQRPGNEVWLVMDNDICAGYFSYGAPNYGAYRDFAFCLNALYLLPGYQRKGLGRRIFKQVRAAADACGQSRFFCCCNAHNLPAQAFYRAMGGRLGRCDTGHENHAEDQLYFEFYTGEQI